MVLAGSEILSADPTAVAALEPATSAEADNRALRIKRAVVDTIPGHGIDLLGSGMMSCADAAPDIMQAMTTKAKADLHIHAPLLLSNREP